MRSWMIGVLVGVLGLGGVAIWMVTSSEEADAPEGAASARNDGATQELPRFDGPAAASRLAAEPTPLAPAAGSPGDPARDAPAPAADTNQLPDGEDVRFSGRVVDGARRPIEGASVSFVAEPMRFGLQLREERGPAEPLPTARTGRDGRFDLPARVPFADDSREGIRFELEAQQLVVRHDAFATLSQSLTQVAGPTYDLGDLTLEPGSWVSGRAVDSDGRPLAGAQARASNTGDRPDGPGALLPFFGRNLIESLEAVTTGADGRFTVRGLRAGQAALDVTKSGLRAGSRAELELPERSGLDVGDVALEQGASIAGLVLDGDGQPLPGAEISVSSMARMVLNRLEDLPRQQLRQELGQRARTDESGRFELSGLAGGTYTVHANAEGFEPLSQTDVPAGTRDLRLSPVPQGGLLVRLTSTDGGAPIEGAELEARPREAERISIMVRAREPQKALAGAEALAAAGQSGDPAGVYFVPHAGIEGTDLIVSAPGFATTALEAPGAPSGDVTEFAAQIAPESVVAGLVADTEGRPVARARLTLSSTDDDDGAEFVSSGDRHSREMRRSIRIGGDDRKSATRHSAVTGVDGRFELRGVAAGEWELGTRAKGFVRSEPQPLTLEEGRSQTDVQVVLEPAGWIAGGVTEPDGAPVAGASIVVEPAGRAPADAGGGSDPLERQMARLESMAAGSSDTRRARTDTRGAYRVGDLAPGEYTVRLEDGPRGGLFGGGAVMFAMEGEPQSDDPGQYAKVEAGQETRVDFQRPERARLAGRVLAGGVPAPDVEVSLRESGRPAFLSRGRTATTDSRGHYEFDDVSAGNYDVSALVPGAALEKTVPVELEAGQARSADLVFGGSTLSGRVLELETDRPAAGVNITVVPVVEGGSLEPQFAFEMVMVGASGSSGSSVTIGGGPEKLVRTDAEGRFEVRYLEAGQYRVEAGGEGFVRANPETVDIKDGENRDDVVLRVQRGAVLSGVVVDSTTGQKLDKVPVRLEGDGAMEMTVTEGGTYRFEGLQPGSYTISVMGSGFFSDPLASEQVTLETGQQATLDLKTKTSS